MHDHSDPYQYLSLTFIMSFVAVMFIRELIMVKKGWWAAISGVLASGAMTAAALWAARYIMSQPH